jgi:stage V sporulation protein G
VWNAALSAGYNDQMDITDVQIFIVNEDKLKAYATITIDACFVVRDLKVIQGLTGIFVAMPAKKRKDGTFRDIAHPLNQQTRELVESKVLQAYENFSKAASPNGSGRPATLTGSDNNEI